MNLSTVNHSRPINGGIHSREGRSVPLHRPGSMKRQPSMTVFDALLCRILALAAAGCDYSQELATAHELAVVMGGCQR